MGDTTQVAAETAETIEKSGLNWILIAVIAIILAGIIFGAVKGALKMIFTVVAIVLAVSLTFLISPFAKNALLGNEKAYNFVYSKVDALAQKSPWLDMIFSMVKDEDEEQKEVSDGKDSAKMMENLLKIAGLDENTRNVLVGDGSLISDTESSMDKYATDGQEKTTKGNYSGATKMILGVAAFILTLVVVGIVLALLSVLTDLLGKLPVINKMNLLIGGALGGLMGLAVVWILFTLLTAFGGSGIGKSALVLINENPLLSFIYTHNPIMKRFLS